MITANSLATLHACDLACGYAPRASAEVSGRVVAMANQCEYPEEVKITGWLSALVDVGELRQVVADDEGIDGRLVDAAELTATVASARGNPISHAVGYLKSVARYQVIFDNPPHFEPDRPEGLEFMANLATHLGCLAADAKILRNGLPRPTDVAAFLATSSQ